MDAISFRAVQAQSRGYQRTRAGFTLVELIVLVLILALGAAILAPTIGHAGLTPNAMVCQSCLRATSLAHALYSDDNNGYICPALANYGSDPRRISQYYPDGKVQNDWTYHWYQLLSAYAGKPLEMVNDGSSYQYADIFHGCPDWKLTMVWYSGYGVTIPLFDAVNGNVQTIGLNYYIYGNPNPIGGVNGRFWRRSELTYPAYRGWMGESTDWHVGGDPTITVYDPATGNYPGWSNTMTGMYRPDPLRHGDGANYVFMDGHAEYLLGTDSGYYFSNIAKILYPGDFSGDGVVNQADYTTWADSYGKTGNALAADGNHDGVVNEADYTLWADHYGETRAQALLAEQAAQAVTASQAATPAVTGQTQPAAAAQPAAKTPAAAAVKAAKPPARPQLKARR